MKNTKTTIIFITWLIISLFSISVFVFFMKVVENKNKHIQNVYQTLEEKILQKNQIDLINKNMELIKQSQEKVNSYFVDSANISTFIDYLENIGSQGGAKLFVNNVEASKTDEKYISIEFTIGGTFNNVIKTINIIENIPHKINLKSMYLNKNIAPDKNQVNKNNKIIYYPWEAQIIIEILNY